MSNIVDIELWKTVSQEYEAAKNAYGARSMLQNGLEMKMRECIIFGKHITLLLRHQKRMIFYLRK